MTEAFVSQDTLVDAYHMALIVLAGSAVVPCPDWNTTQKECSMTMVVKNPLQEPLISRCFYGDPRSLEQYRQEMLDGILDFEVDKGKWTYTYHRRYEGQYQFIIDELRRNPYSRRAVMDIRTPEDMGSEDPACWQHVQYFIRDGALHSKVLFRSNDACKAAYMNMFALILLQKRIADELEVPVGTYTHRANSFHCYERDFELLDKYVERIKNAEFRKSLGLEDDSTVFRYDTEWKELMEAEQEDIKQTVEFLKHKK